MRRSFLAGLGWLLLPVSGCVSPSSEAPRSDDVRASAPGVDVRTGELVEFRSGPLRLRGLLWKPAGPGAAPAVLLNHGSGEADPDRTAGMPMAEAARRLAPSFVRRGYGFFYPFRRGQGASADAGPSLQAVLAREEQAHGPEARQRLQDRLLETEQLDDVMAALAQLESVPGIDPTRVAMAGHSFGGQLTLLAAARDPTLRAAVAFAAAAASWSRSAEVRRSLGAAVRAARCPILLVQWSNDFSTEPSTVLGKELAGNGSRPRVAVYPPLGSGPADGHDGVYLDVSRWRRTCWASSTRPSGVERLVHASGMPPGRYPDR